MAIRREQASGLLKSLQTKLPKSRKTSSALFIALFAIVGTAILLAAHAAVTPAIILPAYSGNVGGGAQIVPDPTAIGQQAVQFTGSGSSSGSAPGTGTGTGTGTGAGSGGGTTTAAEAGCSVSGIFAPCLNATNGTGASGWGAPVFDDEFDSTTGDANKLDTTKWAAIADGGESMENNVKVSASNVSVSGGSLILTLSSSSVGANVTSDPNEAGTGFQFGNGYFLESRIYFPGAGANNLYNWPAFWTSGHSWPNTGEIDIAEVGNGPLTTTYHQASCGNSGNGYECGTASPGGSWANDWHIFAADRESGKITVYWDGKAVKTYTPSDGGANEYFLINVGNSTGSQCNCGGPSVYGTGSQVKIDYVRAWKK